MAASKAAEVILACGGKSLRMGENKLLIDCGGIPLIKRTCLSFRGIEEIKRLIIAVPEGDIPFYDELMSDIGINYLLVAGGKTRQESIHNAVLMAKEDIIIIHDGARPFLSRELILRSLEDAYRYGSSVACVPAKDTIRYCDSESSYCPKRENLYSVQTPQSFSRRLYLYAAGMAEESFTDDAQLLDSIGIKPHLTKGEYSNIKITTPEDLMYLKNYSQEELRVGHGYDVHRLVKGRELILGGVKIPYEKGLLGHSDADVLLHALMDALLGAAALGDIGKHFPDSDPSYSGISSMILLEKVYDLLALAGYKPSNADITVIAQEPKLAGYIQKMRDNISLALGLDRDRISVKATTEEGLGFTGNKEGIAAHAVVTIKGVAKRG